MTFLAPMWLAVAAAAAVVVTALHLIARHRPPPEPLPTARFIPARPARAMTRTLQLSDVALLALRVLLLLLLGAALARPILPPRRDAIVRVIVLDRSRAVANLAAARDSALALLADGDVLVLADSAATLVTDAPRDSLRALSSAAPAAASLSAALIAAHRAAATVRDRADSVEIVLVSPLVREAADAATDSIRATWPGAIRIVRTAAVRADERSAPTVRAPDGDPVAVAASLRVSGQAGSASRYGVRIIRDLPTARDSAFAADGGVLVVWPAAAAADSIIAADTIGGIWSGGPPVIAPFGRARPPRGDRVLAWWIDGRAAAAETVLGRGCIRDVAVDVPTAGDLALRPEFGGLVAGLAAPCGGARDFSPLDDAAVARLAGSPSAAARVATARIAAPVDGSAPLVAWLLAGALVLALLEPFARRSRGEAES